MQFIRQVASFWATILFGCSFVSSAHDVGYVRDIRPILAEKCYACHGPDESTREAGLRLDSREVAIAELPSGKTAILPGKANSSALVLRVFETDADQRMPPPSAKKQLNDSERALLKQWVAEGATFAKHWAFVSPSRPEAPMIQADWGHNAIDQFVYRRMLQNGLSPSPEAEKITLLRRLSLDLRGLPPSVAEVDNFVADDSDSAYERAVDGMLDSIHFGEKLAQAWLDLARYGDTNGYHNDSHRDMWLYRDWVIHAFHTNMPYDQFVREQLAGDVMPNATNEQRIASAFNRNAPFNEEGGADPDEFHVAYAVDRTNTTGQGLLGLTFGCAQCHSHKYDPISQKEYYEFLAFFNSVADEPGGGGENGHHNKPVPPTFAAKSPLRHLQAEQLNQQVTAAQQRYNDSLKTAIHKANDNETFASWVEKQQLKYRDQPLVTELPITDGLVLHLDAGNLNGSGVVGNDADENKTAPTVIGRWHDMSDQKLVAVTEGDRAPKYLRHGIGGKPSVRFDGNDDFLRMTGGAERLDNDFTMVTVHRVWRKKGHQMLLMWGDEAQGKRRALWLTQDKLQFAFNGYSADVIGNKELDLHNASICSITKSGPDNEIQFLLNGKKAGQGNVKLQAFANRAITIGANNAGNENASVDFAEVLVYDRVLAPSEQTSVGEYLASKYAIPSGYDSIPSEIAVLLQTPSNDWTAADREEVAKHFVAFVQTDSAQRLRSLRTELDQVTRQRDSILDGESTVMVMKSMPEPKPTYVLNRGDFQQPGELVAPNVPRIFPPLRSGPPNRLTLAEWITQPNNPLLGRVRVNHLWKLIFGHGLVRTPGDFGTQGTSPTHPELLDWLAVEFVESHWDTKALVKQIVMSATYRQRSVVAGESARHDPENRWLSRAPRFRLSAEEIRDAALTASGLLNRKVGGPSIRPFQPANYFSANSGKNWNPSDGAQRLRRGLYTYWQRTAPYAAFVIFDAPSRQLCTAQRSRTNTPMQALVTLNDPEFHQAAQALAKTILIKTVTSDHDKLVDIWRRVLSRSPNEQEIAVLKTLLTEQRDHYKRSLRSDEASAKANPNSQEVAAWTNVASAVMNLDEAITRE